MADKIRGITIELSGDTSKLSKSLKSVNSSISSTQKQLKDVDRLLKLDPTNTELLRQKQQLLTKQVDETKNKLEQLNKVQAEMDAQGVDKNSAQYQALQREIIATENDLKEAEKAARNFNATLEQVSAVASKVSDATGKAAEKTRGLSTAATGALAGIAGMAYKAATMSDDLNTLSKQTGFTTAELQKMQYAADRIDVPMETIASAATKLTNKLRTSEKTFEEFGVSTRDANGNLRSSTDIFNDVITKLSQIDNETERDAKAMEFFGKSANELAGVIDDGGAALREFGEEAEKAGLILDQETLDGLNAVNDEIDKLKAQGTATLAKAGASALQALTPVIEKVAEVIEKVLMYISQISPETMQVIITVLAVVAAISPLLAIISKLSMAISLLASPIGIAVAIIGALIAVGVLLYKNWDTIKEKAQELWQKVTDTFDRMRTGVSNAIENLRTKVATTWENIKNSITRPIEQAWQTVSGIVDRIRSMFNFELTFPHIKLPHFSWSWNDLGLLKIPNISVEWYKKAYDQPYMFTSPTVVGNRGFGDGNGAEMVYGKESLMRDITQAMTSVISDQPIVITVQSVLDGKIIGKSVTNYQRSAARAMGA